VLLLACLFLPSPLLSIAERERIAARNRWSTLCGSSLCDETCRPGPEECEPAQAFFDAMTGIASHLPESYREAVADRLEQWEGRRPRPIDRLRETLMVNRESQLERGIALAYQHRDYLAHES